MCVPLRKDKLRALGTFPLLVSGVIAFVFFFCLNESFFSNMFEWQKNKASDSEWAAVCFTQDFSPFILEGKGVLFLVDCGNCCYKSYCQATFYSSFSLGNIICASRSNCTLNSAFCFLLSAFQNHMALKICQCVDLV